MEEEEERFEVDVEVGLNKLDGRVCLGVNKASVGEVSGEPRLIPTGIEEIRRS